MRGFFVSAAKYLFFLPIFKFAFAFLVGNLSLSPPWCSWIAQRPSKPLVAGSSPAGRASFQFSMGIGPTDAMTPFILRAQLSSPLIRRGQMTLDAVLMSILNRGDVSDLIRLNPDGLYHASSAHFDNVYDSSRRQTLLASMRPEASPVWAEILDPNTRDGGLAIDPSRAIGAGNVLNTYRAVEAGSIYWMAVGRPDVVLSIMRDVLSMGKGRTSGWGRVGRWRIERYEGDGLYDAGGMPLRPIPVHLLREDFAFDVPTLDLAWRAPYWDLQNRARCVVPLSTQGVASA